MSEHTAVCVGGTLDGQRYRIYSGELKASALRTTAFEYYRIETLAVGHELMHVWVLDGMTIHEAMTKVFDAYRAPTNQEAPALIAKQKQEIEDLYRTLAGLMFASGATITTPTNQERKPT